MQAKHPVLTEQHIQSLFRLVDGKLFRKVITPEDAPFMTSTMITHWNSRAFNQFNASAVWIKGFRRAEIEDVISILTHGAEYTEEQKRLKVAEIRLKNKFKGKENSKISYAVEPYICQILSSRNYRVSIRQNGKVFCKTLKTLSDARAFRDAKLKEIGATRYNNQLIKSSLDDMALKSIDGFEDIVIDETEQFFSDNSDLYPETYQHNSADKLTHSLGIYG